MNPADLIKDSLSQSLESKKLFVEQYGDKLIEVAQIMAQVIHASGKILIMGNGGSASDAQHMAGEMVGRLLIERRPLPAIALSTDTAVLTAVANDYDYKDIFEKQVRALARPGDLVFALSTSGNSANVIRAAECARQLKCSVVALTGGEGGELKNHCDHWLNVAGASISPPIQETHIFAIHTLVNLVDRFYLKESDRN